MANLEEHIPSLLAALSIQSSLLSELELLVTDGATSPEATPQAANKILRAIDIVETQNIRIKRIIKDVSYID